MNSFRRSVLGAGRLLLPVFVGLVGAWLALLTFSSSDVLLGPFSVELTSRLGRGETAIELPPLGALVADTHDSPLRLTATLRGVDVEGLANELRVSDTRALAERVESEALAHMRPYAIKMVGVAVLGGVIAGLALFRRNMRSVALSGSAALALVGISAALAWGAWKPEAFRAPRFTGSLVMAPQLIGSVDQVTDRLEAFRRELSRVVGSAVRTYSALDATAIRDPAEIRVLHISDVHLSPLGFDLTRQLARGFDVAFVLDTGDLTSYGTPLEENIIERIPGLGVPYVFVRGNHDSAALQDALRGLPNVRVLDGESIDIAGLSIYGLGHPAFTEDKEQEIDQPAFVGLATGAAERIQQDLSSRDRPPDIVAVHDDRMARALAGTIPLVVSGHYHKPSERWIQQTLFLRGGTAGGAGVNLLSQPGGVPLSAQILSFRGGDPPQLVAYDLIEQSPTTGSLRIDRRLVSDSSPAAVG